MATNHALEDELRPDAEANRIIEDRDLMDIDIKELNKMLKERNVSKELAVGCTIGAEIYSQILLKLLKVQMNRSGLNKEEEL